ncbi:metal ABC transporter ATP-binding protein [Corynebacterium pseudopelargi]|uniref:Zinc import ATP-binding protein ZnuC n=1 Tax=Corynebacterium pseudopelargi TaxID=2080757 RepID=A0A3G6ISF1_9CORY|nr:metal ABC transporter ATP-binding protein [Corynebacterium pseudopelargi]AZA08407.1 Zinc import ATP-binding protein ZnuC [Corynebacterium pseudopelargi]
MLEIHNLHVNFGARTVLDNVHLHLKQPGMCALLGPNGAGKTTLLRSIMGLIPYRGVVRAPSQRAYVPQMSQFQWSYPMTCLDVVKTGAIRGMWRRSKAADQAQEALELVQMGHLHDRSIAALSGGQRQRLLLARALVDQPELLLLDEPFNGVDVPSQLLIQEVISGLEDTLVVISTHDIPSALATAQTMVLLNKQVVAQGSVQLLQDPALWEKGFGLSAQSSMVRAYVRQVEEAA